MPLVTRQLASVGRQGLFGVAKPGWHGTGSGVAMLCPVGEAQTPTISGVAVCPNGPPWALPCRRQSRHPPSDAGRVWGPRWGRVRYVPSRPCRSLSEGRRPSRSTDHHDPERPHPIRNQTLLTYRILYRVAALCVHMNRALLRVTLSAMREPGSTAAAARWSPVTSSRIPANLSLPSAGGGRR